tara:strand:- start:509 stop:1009 length:501 start_codon:yes stop_codon:yes gene_type:complete
MAIAADSVVTTARGAFPALGAKIGVIENEIDLATISAELVAQGDGVLATADAIEAINLPQGSVVLSAGIEVTETVVGATALEVGLGVTGGDVDQFVTNVDVGASTTYVLTDYLPPNAAGGPWVVGTGAAGAVTDTLDILLGTVTGTVTAGKLRVWAVIADVAGLDG